jgi:hypothetical protein
MESCEIEEHAGILELVVVSPHGLKEFLAGHGTRFRVALDQQHDAHGLPLIRR